MATFDFKGLTRLKVKIDGMISKSPEAAEVACRAGAAHIEAILKSEFINGQVIGRVDNALYQGWGIRSSQNPPKAILGTSVPYARAQELGFQGVVHVKAHTRRKAFRRRVTRLGKLESERTYKRRKTLFQEGPEGGFTIQVQAHSRRMNLRPRHFLSGAVERARPDLPVIMGAVFRREIAG